MPLKALVRDLRDLRDGIGSLSRRTFDVSFSHSSRRVRSQSAVLDIQRVVVAATSDDVDASSDEDFSSLLVPSQQGRWANLPPELLRDVLQRVESAEGSWPARKDVVACSAVCKTWREITKELVKAPEESGKLTFPISLKQPGPRDAPMQCFIKRDRASSTYSLYLERSPSLLVENSKFLLAARKFRKATSTEYIISLDADDMSRGSNSYVGKLRSNFLGTKFTVSDSLAPHSGALVPTGKACRRVGMKQVSPGRVLSGSYNVANIAYELNVLGTRGPRRMQCILHSIPSSVMEVRGSDALTSSQQLSGPAAVAPPEESSFTSIPFSAPSLDMGTSLGLSSSGKAESKATSSPLVLKNKAPRWHDQLQCWCLNFRGRVTVASVKNFQLVAAIEPTNLAVPQSEQDKVLLQFGKIGKDIFTMDYRYPLSAFQAFAICLSSFDTKLACE